MKTLHIAMVGSGSMGRTHAAAVANLPYAYADLPFEAVLHTLVTRDGATALKKANALGFTHAETDFEAVLANPDIDIIDICTPNICHFEQVKAAVKAGKHVLCEKPLGINKAQADELCELAKTTDKVCGMVFNNRHLSAILRARNLVAEGKLGQITSFRCAYLHSSSTNPNKPRGWKQDKTVCGGGVLFDLGSHAIDLLHFVLGDEQDTLIHTVHGLSQIVYPVRAGANGSLWETNADEAFYMTAKLGGGACGTIEASKVCVGTNDDFTLAIYGTDGALKFDLMNPNFLYFYDNTAFGRPYGGNKGFTAIECVNRYDIPESVFPGMRAPVGWFRGHLHGMYKFLNAVATGAPFSPSFQDGAYVNAVMEAAYRSAQEGSVEETGY